MGAREPMWAAAASSHVGLLRRRLRLQHGTASAPSGMPAHEADPASPLDARFDPRLDVCRAALYGYTQNPGDPGGSSADSDEFCRIPSVARPNPHAAHGNAETESRLDTPLSITQPGHAAALPLLSLRPFTADRALAPPFRPAWHRPRAESGREPEAGGLPGTLRRAIGAAEAGGATPSPLGMSTSWPGKDGREVPSVGAFGVVPVPDADIHVVRAQEIRPV